MPHKGQVSIPQEVTDPNILEALNSDNGTSLNIDALTKSVGQTESENDYDSPEGWDGNYSSY